MWKGYQVHDQQKDMSKERCVPIEVEQTICERECVPATPETLVFIGKSQHVIVKKNHDCGDIETVGYEPRG